MNAKDLYAEVTASIVTSLEAVAFPGGNLGWAVPLFCRSATMALPDREHDRVTEDVTEDTPTARR
jgi:hypothetical protein